MSKRSREFWITTHATNGHDIVLEFKPETFPSIHVIEKLPGTVLVPIELLERCLDALVHLPIYCGPKTKSREIITELNALMIGDKK